MKEDLKTKLDGYIKSDVLPMHMPGHKRNPGFTGSKGDITEIEGFDNLHSPKGVIRDLEKKAADIYGADDAFISVNGATALIFAAIHASTFRGEKILVSSGCHISVWHAIETAGLVPVLTDPISDVTTGAFEGLDHRAFIKAIEENGINTAVITTPTYEGLITDTKDLYKRCRQLGCTLIVDESHGAHFGVKGNSKFPETSEGDIVIKSLHKTMASPTQTAVMLTKKDLPFKYLIRHYLAVNESTSPSYILMSGIASALTHTDTDAFFDIVKEGRKALTGLNKLRLYERADMDPSKFVILTEGYLTGYELADRLRKEYRIEVEASFPSYIIAMTGMGDTPETIKRFTDSLLAVDGKLGDRNGTTADTFYPEAAGRKFMLSIENAVKSEKAVTEIKKAEGKMSGEYLFAYPPGVPILIPGEVITGASIKAIEGASYLKTDPFRDFDGTLLTVDI
ncbi:MAG: aminotransferase class I/II-fold pyridoxal phosphate-dependent enzyme [Clostridiales bacterium]|nr:aminotransferase class I/II-fold pyridoxal phosphate-dependent enzyme [Clostridiales bacterium]